MLETATWKEFFLSDLFEISGSKTTKVDELENYGYGKYPYVTTKASNNGVDGFYDFYTENGNCLVIDSAVVGFCTYQELPFSASDHVEVLRPKFEMNQNIALFLVTIINMDTYRYSYGRKRSQMQIKKDIIKLPVDNKGNPNWKYMDNYIEIIQTRKNDNDSSIKNSLDTENTVKTILKQDNWKEFVISTLFDCVLSKGDLKESECTDGEIPLVSSGSTNNGIVKYIGEEGDGKAEIFPGNCITVDMFCNAFYQPKPFYSVSHGRVNILIPKFKMTRNIAIFIVTLINMEQFKYSYGRAVYNSFIESMNIKLPTDSNDNPDWEYMEKYIESLPYADRL